MKKCGKCLEEKNESEFYSYQGRPRHWCKDCDKINTIIRQRIFKEHCIEYKGGECENCGYNKYYGALEFHHKDPDKKEFSIAQVKLRKFDQRVKDELDKCKLLCANCHREEHQKYETEQINNLWFVYQKQREKHNLVSKKEFEVKVLCDCGKEKSLKSNSCLSCSRKKSSKTQDLDINEIVAKIKELKSIRKVASLYNLSDNGLRKYLISKGYNPKTIKE